MSCVNILEAEKQRQNCASLRVVVGGILRATGNDMRRQKECTDFALENRIEETREAKDKLETHLARVGYVAINLANLRSCVDACSLFCDLIINNL